MENLGYSIAKQSEDEIIGTGNKWYWDCFATNLTIVVFMRKVINVDEKLITEDIQRMIHSAGEYDSSLLPVGIQKGRAIIPIYIAEKVEPAVVNIFSSVQSKRFGVILFPAAIDLSNKSTLYLRNTPLWGGFYIPKLRYIVQRLIDTKLAHEKEPISISGILLTSVMLITLIYAIGNLLFLLISR